MLHWGNIAECEGFLCVERHPNCSAVQEKTMLHLTWVPQSRLRSVAGRAERRAVCNPQRALQRGDEPRKLPGDQKQVSGSQI